MPLKSISHLDYLWLCLFNLTWGQNVTRSIYCRVPPKNQAYPRAAAKKTAYAPLLLSCRGAPGTRQQIQYTHLFGVLGVGLFGEQKKRPDSGLFSAMTHKAVRGWNHTLPDQATKLTRSCEFTGRIEKSLGFCTLYLYRGFNLPPCDYR